MLWTRSSIWVDEARGAPLFQTAVDWPVDDRPEQDGAWRRRLKPLAHLVTSYRETPIGMASIVSAFLIGFPALVSIVNPLGSAIIFREFTLSFSHQDRVALARRIAINSFLVMVGSLWAGSYILSFFGISLNALRLAGGLVVAISAYQMLVAPPAPDAAEDAPPVPHHEGDVSAIAFFPLTLPLTTGPGTIAVAVALGTQRPEFGPSLAWFFLGLTLAALAIGLSIRYIYCAADQLDNILGPTGREVVARLAAFILLGIGVQIMLTGALPALQSAFSSNVAAQP